MYDYLKIPTRESGDERKRPDIKASDEKRTANRHIRAKMKTGTKDRDQKRDKRRKLKTKETRNGDKKTETRV